MEPKKKELKTFRERVFVEPERAETGEMESIAQQILRARTGIGWKIHYGPSLNDRLQVIDYITARTDQLTAKMNLKFVEGSEERKLDEQNKRKIRKGKSNRTYVPALRPGEYLLDPRRALSALNKVIGDDLCWARVPYTASNGEVREILVPMVTEEAVYASQGRNVPPETKEAFQTNMTKGRGR